MSTLPAWLVAKLEQEKRLRDEEDRLERLRIPIPEDGFEPHPQTPPVPSKRIVIEL